MKIIRTAAHWLFILCLPFLLISAAIGILANSPWLYEYGAHKYGVGQSLANAGLKLSGQELSGVYAALVHYYNSGDNLVNITVTRDGNKIDILTPEEVLHFKDVKGLIRLDYGVFLGALVCLLACAWLDLFMWHDRRRLWRGLLGGSVLSIALLLALVSLDTVFGFDELFLQFHFLFFNNLLWSAQGSMLLLFPEGLFIDATTIGVAIIAGAALILGGVAWWRLRAEMKHRPGS